MFRQRAFLAGGGAVCGLGAAVVASSAWGRANDQSAKESGEQGGSNATTRAYQCTKTTASAQRCSVVRVEKFLSNEEIQRVIGWWIARTHALTVPMTCLPFICGWTLCGSSRGAPPPYPQR